MMTTLNVYKKWTKPVFTSMNGDCGNGNLIPIPQFQTSNMPYENTSVQSGGSETKADKGPTQSCWGGIILNAIGGEYIPPNK
jgi:hypothetical protein